MCQNTSESQQTTHVTMYTTSNSDPTVMTVYISNFASRLDPLLLLSAINQRKMFLRPYTATFFNCGWAKSLNTFVFDFCRPLSEGRHFLVPTLQLSSIMDELKAPTHSSLIQKKEVNHPLPWTAPTMIEKTNNWDKTWNSKQSGNKLLLAGCTINARFPIPMDGSHNQFKSV